MRLARHREGDDEPLQLAILRIVERDAHWSVRYEVVRELRAEDLDAALAVPVLRKTLRKRRGVTRASAAYLLGDYGAAAEEAVPDLIKALRAPNPSTRQYAARAVGKLRVTRAERELRTLLRGRNLAAAQAARRALEEMGMQVD